MSGKPTKDQLPTVELAERTPQEQSMMYWHERAMTVETERDALREALRELVRLKDLHDRIDGECRSRFFKTADELQSAINDYRTNKPPAWERARELGKGAG